MLQSVVVSIKKNIDCQCNAIISSQTKYVFFLHLFQHTGDNSDIIATDSQKNTVYLLAKKFGIKSPEEFAITLTKHFLSKYRHVKEAHVHVQEYPWDRIRYQTDDNKSALHNHAFVFTPIATRYCDVIHQRTGKHHHYHYKMKRAKVCDTFQMNLNANRAKNIQRHIFFHRI